MKRSSKLRRGSISMICLPLILGMFLIGMSLFFMTTSSSRITNFSSEKVQADALAEAGLNAMYAQMANVPEGSSSVNGTPISSTTLSGKVGSASVKDGSYSANIVSQSSALVNGQLTYTYVIQSTGIAPNSETTSKARTTFTMTQQGMGGFSFGNGAIKANGNVALTGGSFTQDTSGNHGASVLANGSIAANGSKTYIDGVASEYVTTGGSLNGKAYSVDPLSSLMAFPTSSTTSTWRSTWLAQSQEATPTYPTGNVINGNESLTSNTTLTAPMYISGNLSLSGNKTLTLNADPKAATPVVLFVHGTISISGNSVFQNNGVLIVSDSDESFTGNSNTYTVANMVNCGLISFSSDTINAIKITGSSGVANVGIVYAINGGVTLSGGSVYQGSIISGGSVASGSSVTVSGGSSVRYTSGWDALFAPLATSYTAGQLTHWTRLE